MIELPITKDITKYKPKLALGFTTRQIVCLIIAIVLAVPAYLVLSKIFIKDVVYFLCLAIAAPPVLCGFVRKYELPFEKYALIWLRSNFLTPKNRKYKIENTFEKFFDAYDDEGQPITHASSSTTKNNNAKQKKKTTVSGKNKQVSSDPDLFCAN